MRPHILRAYNPLKKKYFYLLRSILAIKWIEQGFGLAPTAFPTLLEHLELDISLREEIHRLMAIKETGNEADHGPQSAILNRFIETERNRHAVQTIDY